MSTIAVYLAFSLVYSYRFYCTTMSDSGVQVATCLQHELSGGPLLDSLSY